MKKVRSMRKNMRRERKKKRMKVDWDEDFRE